MSQDAVERFLGRLITDDDFRENAGKCLSALCFENGLDLTEEERRIVREIDPGLFAPISERIHKGIRRSRKVLTKPFR